MTICSFRPGPGFVVSSLIIIRLTRKVCHRRPFDLSIVKNGVRGQFSVPREPPSMTKQKHGYSDFGNAELPMFRKQNRWPDQTKCLPFAFFVKPPFTLLAASWGLGRREGREGAQIRPYQAFNKAYLGVIGAPCPPPPSLPPRPHDC